MKFCPSVLLLALSMGPAAISQSQDSSGTLLASSQPLPGNAALFPPQTPLQTILPEAPRDALPSVSPSAGGTVAIGSDAQAAQMAWRPLTAQERLILFWNDTYASPGAYLALSAGALSGQISGTPAQWDKDGNGYTRRFASGYGQLAIRNVIHEGTAGVTGFDPRYIPCHCHGAFRRTAHAVEMSFTTYSRDGRVTLDVPQIAGAYGSGMISTYWYPHGDYNPLVQGIQFGHEEMGEVFLGNMAQEFSTELKHIFHRHTSSAVDLSTAVSVPVPASPGAANLSHGSGTPNPSKSSGSSDPAS